MEAQIPSTVQPGYLVCGPWVRSSPVMGYLNTYRWEVDRHLNNHFDNPTKEAEC